MHSTLAIVGAALLSLVAAQDDSYRTLNTVSNPDWMGGLDDSRGLHSLSIPGTHESMAITGGSLTQCQENYGASADSLTAQAQAGIRMFDIRLRIVENNKFAVHHGATYQNANFDDVINKLGGFLDAHPEEAVILRVKQECTGDIGSCTDVGGQSDFATIFDTYAVNDHFWQQSVSRSSAAAMPILGDIRGKIVVAVINGPNGGRVESYGLEQFSGWHDGSSDYVQDEYNVPNTGAIATKRDQVCVALVVVLEAVSHARISGPTILGCHWKHWRPIQDVRQLL